MRLEIGSRWASEVSDVEVVIVKSPKSDVALACGGHAVIPIGSAKSGGSVAEGDAGEVAIGKRYTDSTGELEVIVTKGGKGSLVADGEQLQLKGAKLLPSSD